MSSIHFAVPDLFLPPSIAAEACRGLRLPALEMLLARAGAESLYEDALEDWLCAAFGVPGLAVAPVTLQADGIEPGNYYWLRADPVHVVIRRNQMVVQDGVALSAEEAGALCAALDGHFAADGLRFFAPHPQRWYVRLEAAPQLETTPLPRVVGEDACAHLPRGADALRWHKILNEIQMLLYAHPVNQAREERGELPVNSVWLWGGGQARQLAQPYPCLCGDSELAAAFVRPAGIACAEGMEQCVEGGGLVVYEALRHALRRGDLDAWRAGVQELEQNIASSMRALRAGRIERVTLDVLREGAPRSFVLTRGDTWKLWRRPVSLPLCA